MARPKRQSLGRGLDALFVDNQVSDNHVTMLRITEVEPNELQPRTSFDETSLRELADSIAQHGVLQPLVVRPLGERGYQIVAGERRWRASRIAGLSEIPAIIRELTDSESLEIAIIENLQREDLNPVELALGYQALLDNYSFTQEKVAQTVGKSRSAVANTLRLLQLPEPVLEELRRGELSQGHARALLGIKNEDLLMEVFELIHKDNLTVRQVEHLAQREEEILRSKQEKLSSNGKKLVESSQWGEATIFKEIELALASELARKVTVSHQGEKGQLVLEFYTQKDLEDLAAKLTQ